VFFQNYFSSLTAHLTNYVSGMTAAVAGSLTPIIVAFATMYVMFWGWLHLSGKIEEPVLEGAKRILTIGVVLSLSLTLWTNHSAFVLAFLNGPSALASAILGGGPPLAAIDNIWTQGSGIAKIFWDNAGVFDGNFGLYFGAVATWIVCGLLCVYTAFLFALASVALAILLAVGPLFLMFLFFDSTKKFFESWIAQLANYALVVIIASLIGALILNLVSSMANQTVSVGANLTVFDAMNFLITTILAFLLMRQTMSVASGLASGVALATGNLVSGLLRRGMGGAGQFNRGMFDAMTGNRPSRFDPASRYSGNVAARGVGQGAKAVWRVVRPSNSIGKR
jgi:type IV secretion system protein VirB6